MDSPLRRFADMASFVANDPLDEASGDAGNFGCLIPGRNAHARKAGSGARGPLQGTSAPPRCHPAPAAISEPYSHAQWLPGTASSGSLAGKRRPEPSVAPTTGRASESLEFIAVAHCGGIEYMQKLSANELLLSAIDAVITGRP